MDKGHGIPKWRASGLMAIYGHEWCVSFRSPPPGNRTYVQVKTLTAEEMLSVSKAFAHFFSLANAAEKHHR